MGDRPTVGSTVRENIFVSVRDRLSFYEELLGTGAERTSMVFK